MLTAGDLVRDAAVERAAAAPAAPRVSVVLPTWRRARHGALRRAVESVLAQDFGDLELIVVDDGSTDGTHDLLRGWQREDPRLVIVRHELNSGLPALRVNEGIELARGRWVGFQMDDDVWLPGALRALVEAGEAAGGEPVVYGRAELVSDAGTVVLPSTAVDRVLLSFENRLANVAVLAPAALLRRCGMYDPHVGMRRLCDWDLWLRLARHADFVGVDRLVARVAVGADASSLGRAVPADLPLFRYLQAIDRDRHLTAARWREVEVDTLAPAGVAVPGVLGERLLRQQLESWRRARRQDFLQLAGSHERPATAPRTLLLTSDSFYNALDLCFGHYDAASLRRGGCKQVYMPLLQRAEGWTAQADVVLLVRATTGSGRAALVEASQAGRPAGYYLDDDLLHLHEHGEAFAHLAPGGAQHAAIVEQLALADAVWSTSPVITDSVLPHTPRVVPHNGSIPESWLPRELRPRAASGRLRIGYVGNAFRSEEFALVWDGLRAVARRHRDEVELEFWGLDPADLPPLECPVRHRPFVQSFALFGERLRTAGFDVLLTPLLDEPRARRAKAPSKYYLAAAAGALGIFSAVEPYRDLPHGVGCLKAANTAEAWEAALEEAIRMPAGRFDAMRRAMVEHVRLEYTEAAQIHLHEAAIAATELHHATRRQRVDGRPTLLFALASDASPRALRELLRHARLVRAYGFGVHALCAGDAIGQQAALAAADVRWDAVAAGLLSDAAPAGDPWPVRNFLERLRPALVQGSGALPLLAATCAAAGVPWVGGLGDSVDGATFAAGLQALLREVAAPTPTGERRPRIVMVGELVPMQRQLEAIELVARWTGAAAPRLEVWADAGADAAYANRCRRRIHELDAGGRIEVLRRTGGEGEAIAGADLLLDLGDEAALPESVALGLAAAVPVLTSSPGAFAAGLVEGVTAFRLADASVEAIGAAAAELLAASGTARRVAHAGYAWARAGLHPQRAASALLHRHLDALRGPAAATTPGGAIATSSGAAPAATLRAEPTTPTPALPAASAARPASRRDRLRALSQRAHVYRPLSRLYWRTRRRRVLVVSGPSLSMHLYYELAHDALEAASGRRWVFARPDQVDPADLHSFHAVVLMLARSPRELELLRAARRAGCLTVYDTDDNLLRLAEVIPDAENPWRRQLDPARPVLEALQREADVLKVYSRSAVPIFRELNPNVVCVRPFQPSMLPLPEVAAARRPVKIGFLGSLFKDAEFAAVVTALRRLLDREPGIVVEFFGFLPAALRDDPRVSYVPLVVPWEAYRARLQALEWDIALAPLRDLPYNRCKNAVKYREYASAGIAGVYADMPVYADVVRDGETGLLVAPDDDRAWEEAILRLVRDPDLRARVARNAHRDVAANCRVEAYAAEVAALLESSPRPRRAGRG